VSAFRAALAFLLAGPVLADVPMHPAMSVERLANGNTLIAVGTSSGGLGDGLVIEVDSLTRLVWAYVRTDIPWAHSARRLSNGNTLMSSAFGNRVVEVDALGNTVWEHTTGLSYPNEACRLADGNTLITDRDNNRVIEVNPGGAVVWDYTDLRGPHHGNRLANGNTLISDSDGNRVVEVDPGGQVVWTYADSLRWPRAAQRLPDGNTLITDSNNRRILEVDSTGVVRWDYSTGTRGPYMALRLESGNTLLSAEDLVLELNPQRQVIWKYPPAAPVVETCRVANQTSGCSLYVHIHRAAASSPARRVPAVVLVPDELFAGTSFDLGQFADHLASDGFAVLHFDAEGRGRSPGVEDYNGTTQQDGLAACVAALAAQPYVDTSAVGIYSQGYGVAMAAGMLARHDGTPVKFLLDREGPSDRHQVCADSGGCVPVSPDSQGFWSEREAGNTIRGVRCAYLRIQYLTDFTRRIPDNRHAVALIDSATAIGHGGAGHAVWTRVNDSTMNPENHVYSVVQPPDWIPDVERKQLLSRELLYLHELAGRDFPPALAASPSSLRASPFTVSPNPCRRGSLLRLNTRSECPAALRLYDASGRLTLSCPVRTSSFPLSTSGLAAGACFLRLSSGGRVATCRLVLE
jgi:hypothetical protein